HRRQGLRRAIALELGDLEHAYAVLGAEAPAEPRGRVVHGARQLRAPPVAKLRERVFLWRQEVVMQVPVADMPVDRAPVRRDPIELRAGEREEARHVGYPHGDIVLHGAAFAALGFRYGLSKPPQRVTLRARFGEHAVDDLARHGRALDDPLEL